jgi:hypothetical protein
MRTGILRALVVSLVDHDHRSIGLAAGEPGACRVERVTFEMAWMSGDQIASPEEDDVGSLSHFPQGGRHGSCRLKRKGSIGVERITSCVKDRSPGVGEFASRSLGLRGGRLETSDERMARGAQQLVGSFDSLVERNLAILDLSCRPLRSGLVVPSDPQGARL